MEIQRIKINKHIGEQIIKNRLNKKINLTELAQFLEIDEDKLESYEKGKEEIPTAILFQISLGFSMNISDFIK